MPDKIESYKVVCKGGLNSNENHLDLSEDSPGAATRLVNFEPSLFGGYRRIEGFESYNSLFTIVDPVNAEGQIMGLNFFRNDTNNTTQIFAQRKVKKFRYVATAGQTAFTGLDSNSRTMDLPVSGNVWAYVTSGSPAATVRKYNITHFSVSGSTVTFSTPLNAGDIVEIDPQEIAFYYYSTGWQKFSLTSQNGTIFRRAAVLGNVKPIYKVRHSEFNFGAGNTIVFVDGANPALVFDGTHWTQLTSTGAGSKATTGGGDSCINFPAVVDVFKNHLFLGGDPTAESVLCHSKPLDPFNFTAAAGGGQLLTGFDIVDFKAFRDDLFVFGENKIKKISVDAASTNFTLAQVTNNVGCIARDSVLEIGGDLVFLAPDGVRPVAGTSRIGDVELETISKSIQQLLTTLPRTYDLSTLVGVVVRSKSQMRYFVQPPTVGFAADSFGILGALRSADQRLGWEFGEILGIRASAACSAYVNNEELVLHGDHDGKVFRQETGNSFDGEDILGVYTTPFFDFGETEVRKNMRKVNTFVRAEGPLKLNLAVNYDWYDQRSAKPSSYVMNSTGSPVQYKGTNINYAASGVSYGGSDKPIMQTDIQGSGFSTQITYVSQGQTEPYSIQGIVFEFTVAGRI